MPPVLDTRTDTAPRLMPPVLDTALRLMLDTRETPSRRHAAPGLIHRRHGPMI
jgi:hypothetical protein